MDAQIRNEFILQQLLALARVIDVTDQYRRQEMLNLVRAVLANDAVTHALVAPLVALYIRLSSSSGSGDRECVDALVELISDVRMPMTHSDCSRSIDEQRQRDVKVGMTYFLP